MDETDGGIEELPSALTDLRSRGGPFHIHAEAQLPASAWMHYMLDPAASASACRALSVIAKTVSVATVSAMAVS